MGSYVENNIREKRSHAMQQERGYFNDSVTHLCVCVCVCVCFVPFYYFLWATFPDSRYDTSCYSNVRTKADMSQLNLPHGTDN